MFARPALLISIIQALLLLGDVEARSWLLERDGRAIYARRFGQEQPAVLREIATACGGGICDTLAGEAVSHHLVSSFGFPPSVLNAALMIEDSGMIDVLFGFWLLRSLRYWLPSQSVRSRTWLIRSSVRVPSDCARHAMG